MQQLRQNLHTTTHEQYGMGSFCSSVYAVLCCACDCTMPLKLCRAAAITLICLLQMLNHTWGGQPGCWAHACCP